VNSIKVFKHPSKLKVVIDPPPAPVSMLSGTVKGDTFLREGALCMRVELGYHCEREGIVGSPALWIINLQTGRVWAAGDRVIDHVKACLTLEGGRE
jgi:hypothetical protein